MSVFACQGTQDGPFVCGIVSMRCMHIHADYASLKVTQLSAARASLACKNRESTSINAHRCSDTQIASQGHLRHALHAGPLRPYSGLCRHRITAGSLTGRTEATKTSALTPGMTKTALRKMLKVMRCSCACLKATKQIEGDRLTQQFCLVFPLAYLWDTQEAHEWY